MKTAMKQVKNAIAATRKKQATFKEVCPRYAQNAGSATTDVIRG